MSRSSAFFFYSAPGTLPVRHGAHIIRGETHPPLSPPLPPVFIPSLTPRTLSTRRKKQKQTHIRAYNQESPGWEDILEISREAKAGHTQSISIQNDLGFPNCNTERVMPSKPDETSGYMPERIENRNSTDSCTPVSVPALFAITERRKQPKHSIIRWVDKQSMVTLCSGTLFGKTTNYWSVPQTWMNLWHRATLKELSHKATQCTSLCLWKGQNRDKK